MASFTIGVDVGGTKCLALLCDDAGAAVDERRLPTPRGGDALIDAIVTVASALRDAHAHAPADADADAHADADADADAEIVGVAVGVPGLVGADGTLHIAPNLPGVKELRVGPLVAERLGLDHVRVDNDATCAGWGETIAGAARGAANVLLATLGTGIGGGLVADGRLVRGANGFAGEIGHVVIDPHGPRCPCGQRGCWERYASGSGLGWLAREAAHAGQAAHVVELAGGDPEDVRGEHVTAAAAAGDPEAQEVMDRFAWWLALGLANLANIFDPERIVIGGGLVEAGAVLIDPTRRAFSQLVEGMAYRHDLQIVPAALGERAGAVGAALLARPEAVGAGGP
jgi:glucokinase